MKTRKKTPHLDYYNKCMSNSEKIIVTRAARSIYSTPYGGLCNAFTWEPGLDQEALDLFEPTVEDVKWLIWEGHDVTYWGSNSSGPEIGVFTPLRQTILLLIAAEKGEL